MKSGKNVFDFIKKCIYNVNQQYYFNVFEA